ncbi:unnamed protein product, partial [Dicrocoelium dendriticum]
MQSSLEYFVYGFPTAMDRQRNVVVHNHEEPVIREGSDGRVINISQLHLFSDSSTYHNTS